MELLFNIGIFLMGVGVGIILYMVTHRHVYVIYNKIYEYTCDDIFWSKKGAEKFLKDSGISEKAEKNEYRIEKCDVH